MKDIKLKDKIAQGINDLFYIWKREFQTTFRDQGVLIFFILVPLGYPLLYSFIYDNEVVREVPAVVVDDSHSSLSREYLRKVDATPDIQIVSYCADMEEAKQMLKNRRAYGIIFIHYKTITKPDGKEDVDAFINVVKKAQKCSDVNR